MAQAAVSESDFIQMIEQHGPTETARRLGVAERNVYDRRARLEDKLGRTIVGPTHANATRTPTDNHSPRHLLTIPDGVVLVGSDAHYWPGTASPAHRAFVLFCQALRPAAVIMNGDVFDGSSVSRHPPIGWEKQPLVQDEIEAAKGRLAQIEVAAGEAALVWTLGNHDARFETRLATVAPQYANVHGVHLRDHFPAWTPAWSAWINDAVVVKHRFKNGIHATHQNAVSAGKSMVTGHLHSLKVTPWTDYTGTRFGVDTGTLADPDGPQFMDYTEDNPKNWRAGFTALTFRGGRLMWPEVVHVIDKTHVEFRGEIIEV